MIQPLSFKFKCSKCGYTKVVKPKSDVINPIDMINICPKCNSTMKKLNLNRLEKLFR